MPRMVSTTGSSASRSVVAPPAISVRRDRQGRPALYLPHIHKPDSVREVLACTVALHPQRLERVARRIVLAVALARREERNLVHLLDARALGRDLVHLRLDGR